jgi:hypothetical protein
MIVLLLLALTTTVDSSSEAGPPADATASDAFEDPAELAPEPEQRRRIVDDEARVVPNKRRVVDDKQKPEAAEKATSRVRPIPDRPEPTRRDFPGFFTHLVETRVGGELVHARVLSSVPLAVPAWLLAFAALPILPLTMNIGALLGLFLYVADVQSGSSGPLALLIPIGGLVAGATWPFAVAGVFHAFLAAETATRASKKLDQELRERQRATSKSASQK